MGRGRSEKQDRFAEEYVVDLNAGAAAIRAGYAVTRAKQTGWRLLQDERIQKKIQTLKAERTERTGYNADYVLYRAAEIVERCMQREAILDKDGNPTGEYKFDSAGACKALKLLGDHVDINAFKKADDNGVPIDQNWVLTIVDAKDQNTEKT